MASSVLRSTLRVARHSRALRSVAPRASFSASASTASDDSPTGIVMLNMGGPATQPEVGPFLSELFGDSEIIDLGPMQNYLGPFIAKRRTPKIEEQYEQIGGSPIRKWTKVQGEGMVERLNEMTPGKTHKAYTCFRYAQPQTEEALLQMKADGVKRAVAFSQYPHWSCTTAGSSMNHLWRELRRLGLENEFTWSVIDRWPIHPTFIKAVANRVRMGLAALPDDETRAKTIIMFSAHSLPMKVVNKGDQYPQEVAATVQQVMKELGYSNPYTLCWQSKVGYLPWLGPSTSDSIKGLGRQGHESVMAVPIAFTSDHVETLFEIDIEYKEEADEAGIKHFTRAPSLNDEPLLMQAQAELVKEHLEGGKATASAQYAINCAGCVNPDCRTICNPVEPYQPRRPITPPRLK